MNQFFAPIVGMHSRPPAKLVLSALPAGAGLRLEPEPENPYDELAVRVMARPRDMVMEAAEVLDWAASGHELAELLAREGEEEWIHLGYVARNGGKAQVEVGNEQVHGAASMLDLPVHALAATLTFDVAGKPMVLVGAPSADGAE